MLASFLHTYNPAKSYLCDARMFKLKVSNLCQKHQRAVLAYTEWCPCPDHMTTFHATVAVYDVEKRDMGMGDVGSQVGETPPQLLVGPCMIERASRPMEARRMEEPLAEDRGAMPPSHVVMAASGSAVSTFYRRYLHILIKKYECILHILRKIIHLFKIVLHTNFYNCMVIKKYAIS